jgi:hypothetical protein
MMAFVYLPDDEHDVAVFNSSPFVLQPNQTTEFCDYAQGSVSVPGKHYSRWPKHTGKEIADHVANYLSKWGVVVTAGPVKNGEASLEEDQPLVDQAERTYLASTKEWAEDGVSGHVSKQKSRSDRGLAAEPESADVSKCRAWLSQYSTKLKKAGLVA